MKERLGVPISPIRHGSWLLRSEYFGSQAWSLYATPGATRIPSMKALIYMTLAAI
jgi:hypothetical protein